MNKIKYLNDLKNLLIENGEKEKDIQAAIKYAENLINLNLPVIFDKYHFAALVGMENVELANIMVHLEEKYYRKAEIEKKNGGMREILMEDMRNEAAREAEKMKAIRMTRLMIEDGKLSYEDIAMYIELTLEEVEKIALEKKSA